MEYTYEYLPWRGVAKETMEFYGVRSKISDSGVPISLGYQYPNGSYKVRDLSAKSFHSVGEINKGGLFGRNLFDPGVHKYVTITEGELDALSCYQMLRGPAVSVQSSSSAVRDCRADYAWLSSFDRIYLALDGDAAGKRAASDIARMFDYGKVFHVKLNRHKDANEYLQNGEETEFKNLWWNSKKYLPETIKSSLSDFETILKEKTELGIPYPFQQLTEMTYGIRTGESVLVTAQEGVGKTEFLHALEYSILRQSNGQHDANRLCNVGALFLEETARRHLHALAGIHLQRPTHLPDSGCTDDEVVAAVREVLQTDDRLFVDTHFGSTDVESLLGNIRFLVSGCGCRVVILDHISVAVGVGDGGEDERKQLDHFFTKAEMMVKELDFALIVVSHVNDFGQTRGSRWGGKMADIRIDLTRDTANGSNILDVFVSKNRFAGRTGHAGSYEFNPVTRQYKMVGANDNEIPAVEPKPLEEAA